MAKEYIEREAALNKLLQCADDYAPDCSDITVAHAVSKIKEIPAADVRPVVFCKDCIHYEMGVCLKIYDDGTAAKEAWQERKPDDFCSCGSVMRKVQDG